MNIENLKTIDIVNQIKLSKIYDDFMRFQLKKGLKFCSLQDYKLYLSNYKNTNETSAKNNPDVQFRRAVYFRYFVSFPKMLFVYSLRLIHIPKSVSAKVNNYNELIEKNRNYQLDSRDFNQMNIHELWNEFGLGDDFSKKDKIECLELITKQLFNNSHTFLQIREKVKNRINVEKEMAYKELSMPSQITFIDNEIKYILEEIDRELKGDKN